MLAAFRVLAHLFAAVLALPAQALRFLVFGIILHPALGKLRYVAVAAALYVAFALLLVYVFAPIRGYAGYLFDGGALRYASERWTATAIYDSDKNFVGTFDPILDSKRDVNYSGMPIELATGYVANPDHKSIPVLEVPDAYWRCLVFHEDRNIGTWINPFGIDLFGVLKIPYSTAVRSVRAGRLSLGVGGSTLPMQLSRVIYKTPPRVDESAFEKLHRKFGEWYDAPVIYWTLTSRAGGEPLRHWAANHLWLAQRTAGAPLHGVETASRIVFGKPAAELSVAEQFVLASAVNKPIILLEGNEKLNAVRLDRWRYIVDERARRCAGELIADEAEQKAIWFELTKIANGPPDPQVKPKLQKGLEELMPASAKVAQANPVLRANLLIPAARYGVREEMKQAYGFGWRDQVRAVTLTLDVIENRRFRERVKTELKALQEKYSSQIDPQFSLDLAAVRESPDLEVPNVVIAAADKNGDIVRYFESKDTAAYFGSAPARDQATGKYDSAKETRAVASVGKMLVAIGIANEGRDSAETLYADPEAPATGLDTCRHDGTVTRGRRARVAFACSLSKPIEGRAARLGQARVRKLIDDFGLTMPPKSASGEETPPSTAAARGLLTASPRKVHQLAAVVLSALTGRGDRPVPLPTLVKSYDHNVLFDGVPGAENREPITPANLIRGGGEPLLKTLLSAPLCASAGNERIGTLKSISDWCAERKAGVTTHFAKTGTQVTLDPDATVDAWAAGGIQFATGASYSYVVVVGTGNAQRPWARALHAAQIAAPLVAALLEDLEAESRRRPAVAEVVGD